MKSPATTAIARHLARTLGGTDPDARLALALACEATQGGHVCADLDAEAGWGAWAGELDAQYRAAFRARLPALPVVGGPDEWTPLVWDGRRLFLRRYWDYERRVVADLLGRAQETVALAAEAETKLAVLFPDAGQRAAARIALSRKLCLVSGGPGTGKTTTLARMIGLLCEQAAPPPRIALAAPTGKAAARMAEALRQAGAGVEGGALTLHRLLGMRADGSGFARHRERPLATDLLVVDEASMIDLSLMAHLLDALPAEARLVMLGDRDQLAAVEAGAVFADLCASDQLSACVASLATSFRFNAASGIGRLAGRLREGDAAGALELLAGGAQDLSWRASGGPRELIDAARAGYADYLHGITAGLPPAELFARFGRFRVLCAHRQDVAALNAAFLPADVPRPPLGTPLMILRNDSLLRLFNGDIGLILVDPADGAPKACFPGEGGADEPRWIALQRLPEWEPAWAMTVHKSQGSEFEHVILHLPTAPSPVATRELVYTGLTRARGRVELWASAEVLRAAVERRAERMSGLRDRLA